MALEIGKNAPAGKYSNVSLLVDEIVSFRSFIFFIQEDPGPSSFRSMK